MTSRQLLITFVVMAVAMHVLCFNWVLVSGPAHNHMVSEFSVFWSLADLPGDDDYGQTLYVLYEWSYGYFQGINILLTLAGFVPPLLLLLVAAFREFNAWSINAKGHLTRETDESTSR
jgi:hypothetical protein